MTNFKRIVCLRAIAIFLTYGIFKTQMSIQAKPQPSNDSLIRRVILLSWFTVIYNLAEGIFSIGFGISEDSVALAGFGVDSLIEVASAFLVLWRFRSESSNEDMSISRERRATFGIGILFLILAIITFAASVFQIISRSHPETTLPGVVISLVSLSFMFYLYKAKTVLGQKLKSITVLKDASCSLACIKLSCVLLTGSFVYYVMPSFWWVDAGAAIVIAFFILKEGIEIVQQARSGDFSGGCCH